MEIPAEDEVSSGGGGWGIWIGHCMGLGVHWHSEWGVGLVAHVDDLLCSGPWESLEKVHRLLKETYEVKGRIMEDGEDELRFWGPKGQLRRFALCGSHRISSEVLPTVADPCREEATRGAVSGESRCALHSAMRRSCRFGSQGRPVRGGWSSAASKEASLPLAALHGLEGVLF